MIKSAFIDRAISYNGSQLSSHWIYKQTGMTGSCIVSFRGPADVPLSNMVDLEDVRNSAPIFSNEMLHFIVEHFDGDLDLAIARQRLLVAIAADKVRSHSEGAGIKRKNDDLFIADKKLSVSIATQSPVSHLIHFAVNIRSDNTPVPTCGLADLKIEANSFADEVMCRYCDEVKSMHLARCKVRAVA